VKFTVVFLHRFRWVHLPAALLATLLQRTPVLRVLAASGEAAAGSTAGQLVRSLFTVAALGALHSRAGATTFVQSPASNPIPGTVGTTLSVAFTYTGTPSPPQYFAVTGTLPPGLSYIPAPLNGILRTGTPAISGTPTTPGNYTINVQGFGTGGNGNPQPIRFAITGAVAPTPPVFTTHPAGQTLGLGANVTLAVAVTGSPAPTYQWRKNGNAILGATAATLALSNVQPADSGDYTVVAINASAPAGVTSAIATLTVVDPNARLNNLSVRTAMASGQTLIVGVVVSDGTRDILVRAAGPALAAFGLTTAMTDPRLELYDSSTTLVLSNDNWPPAMAAAFASVGAFPFPAGSRDAAFVRSLNAAYSIQARGTGAGVVLVEAYDTGAVTTARMVNVSARNRVGSGDDLLIAGFNITGVGPKRLLIRAVGPKLGAFGVTGVLTDPKLEIYNTDGVKLIENDNWTGSLAAAFTAVGAFGLDANSRDAALVTALPPGSYTAQVRGADGGTGEALIEIYEVP